jgi:di/tricarboxylate transporter
MFEFAKIGIFVALAGLAVVIVLAPVLLPARESGIRPAAGQAREYLVRMGVVRGGSLEGKTLADAGLGHVRVALLERGDEAFEDAGSDVVLQGGDLLTLRALPDEAVELQQQPGLRHVDSELIRSVSGIESTYYEVVIGSSSPLVGRPVEHMERRYDAAVVAVRRSGADVEDGRRAGLRAGDTLLVLAHSGFEEEWRNRTDFVLVSRLGGPPPTATRHAPIALVVLVGIVALAATGVLPVVEAALAGVGALIVLRVITPNEALRAVNYGILLVIGAAFGLGAAVQESGLADVVADGVVRFLGPLPDAAVIAGLLAVTMALTEIISNTAAAIIAFPIAVGAAAQVGVDPRLMAIGVAVASTSSFVTPIGATVNTMVYGAGGYRFADFARLGLPLALVVLAVTTTVITLLE